MATLLDLDQAGNLSRLDVLDPGQQEFREFYASPGLRTWLQDVLPTMTSSYGIELSPLEQFDALTAIFCAGDRLTYETSFRPLRNVADGVWELKTDDLRIFGWFSRKDCFIGVVADDATRIKKHRLYHGYGTVTVPRFRDQLNLDAPKFVPGDDPHAVVSNFDYP